MAAFDLDDIQEQIHMIAELNTDTPSSGDDDYEVRKVLTKKWIRSWENEEGMLWDELYTAAEITSTATSSYDLSVTYSNFKLPGGFVATLSSDGTQALQYYNVIKPGELELKLNSSEAFCYFLGNPNGGYTLYFNNNNYPSTAGDIIFIPYYKSATLLTAGAIKPEMSNPMYIVHGVVSDIYSAEDPQESDKHFQTSQKILADMKLRNLMKAPYQSNAIQTRQGLLANHGFGR